MDNRMFTINEEVLTDGSSVYDVVGIAGNSRITLNAITKEGAEALADALNRHVLGFSISVSGSSVLQESTMYKIEPEEISVGDRVRSFDFPRDRRDCYVDGKVLEIGVFPGVLHQAYKVAVDRMVWNGHVHEVKEERIVYPPINGLAGLHGPTNGVVRI